MPDNQILTVKETAAYLQRSVLTVYRRIKAGQLKAVKEGHDYRIRKEWLEDYISRCGAAS